MTGLFVLFIINSIHNLCILLEIKLYLTNSDFILKYNLLIKHDFSVLYILSV